MTNRRLVSALARWSGVLLTLCYRGRPEAGVMLGWMGGESRGLFVHILLQRAVKSNKNGTVLVLVLCDLPLPSCYEGRIFTL